MDESDPFVRSAVEEDKASLVGIMMLKEHGQGLRGKQTTAFTAALPMRFAQQGLSTEFLNSPVIAMVGTVTSVKLPICESLLIGMKARMWTRRSWTGTDIRDRMTYIGYMLAFEMGRSRNTPLPCHS